MTVAIALERFIAVHYPIDYSQVTNVIKLFTAVTYDGSLGCLVQPVAYIINILPSQMATLESSVSDATNCGFMFTIIIDDTWEG